MSWVFQTKGVTGGPQVVEADLSVSGASTLTLVSGAIAIVVAAMAGVTDTVLAGSATVQSELASAGASAFDAAGATVKLADLNSSGLSDLAIAGATIKATVLDSSGSSTFDAQGEDAGGAPPVETEFSMAGTSTFDGVGGFLLAGEFSSGGASTLSLVSQLLVASDMESAGVSLFSPVSGVVAGSVFNMSGVSEFIGITPSPLVPASFKPIEQRRIRLPKLSRGMTPEQWIDVATREFDSFFNDLHHYLASNTFVPGVHTETLIDGFTLTPETSVIFVTSDHSVISSAQIAIKSISTVPKIFIIINTGLFPITLKDDANTHFGGSDITLLPGKTAFLTYTGVAWVGNAI